MRNCNNYSLAANRVLDAKSALRHITDPIERESYLLEQLHTAFEEQEELREELEESHSQADVDRMIDDHDEEIESLTRDLDKANGKLDDALFDLAEVLAKLDKYEPQPKSETKRRAAKRAK